MNCVGTLFPAIDDPAVLIVDFDPVFLLTLRITVGCEVATSAPLVLFVRRTGPVLPHAVVTLKGARKIRRHIHMKSVKKAINVIRK